MRRLRQRPHVRRVPRPGQARGLEDRVEQAGGEAPDLHVGDAERGADEPGGMPQPVAVRRVGQVGQRHPGDPRHLVRVADRHVPRVVPPADDRHDQAVGRRQEQLLQRGEHAHAGRVDARPPPRPRAAPSRPGSRRPGRRRHRGTPAGRRGCAGAPTSRSAGRRARGALAEEDQHGRAPGRRRRPAASGAAAAGRRPQSISRSGSRGSQLHPEVLARRARAARRRERRPGRPACRRAAPSASRK